MPLNSCACPRHDDPVACMDLRYHGRSPGPISERNRESGLREECECVCHQEWQEEQDQLEDDGLIAPGAGVTDRG